jgi:hypothetical protein
MYEKIERSERTRQRVKLQPINTITTHKLINNTNSNVQILMSTSLKLTSKYGNDPNGDGYWKYMSNKRNWVCRDGKEGKYPNALTFAQVEREREREA